MLAELDEITRMADLMDIDAYHDRVDELMAELSALLPDGWQVEKLIQLGKLRLWSVRYWYDVGHYATSFTSENQDADRISLLESEIAYIKEVNEMANFNIFDTGVIKYMAGDMVGNKTFTAVIRDVKMEDAAGEQKPVLWLKGRKLGIVLNTTNAKAMMMAYGHMTGAWVGKEIRVSARPGKFFGKPGYALVVAPISPAGDETAPVVALNGDTAPPDPSEEPSAEEIEKMVAEHEAQLQNGTVTLDQEALDLNLDYLDANDLVDGAE